MRQLFLKEIFKSMLLISKMRTGEMPVLHEKYITGRTGIPPVLLYDLYNTRIRVCFTPSKETMARK
jgi:hypothetical protein